MTTEAAANLIREKEGRLCVRFYQRADGTVLTADCPVGAQAFVRRVKRLVAAGVALLVPAFATPLWYQQPPSKAATRGKVYQTVDAALVAIKNWVNPQPPAPLPVPPTPGRFLLGDVYIPPPSAPAPSPSQPTSAQPGN